MKTTLTYEEVLALPYASVVMLESDTGTAYQRHFSDGRFHGTGGKILTCAQVAARRYAVVIYTAPVDPEEAQR